MPKGQIETADLIIAIGVLILLTTILIYTWNVYNTRLEEGIDNEKMQLQAFQITDMLVKTPGFPPLWETQPANAQAVGFATDDRVISAAKFDAFASLDYNTTKGLFDLKAYEYRVRIKNLAGAVIKEAGLNETSADVKRVVVYRYVIYNDEKALLEFAIWE